MKKSLFTTVLFAVLLMCGTVWGQHSSYPPYDFTSVNADGDTLYYRITSSVAPYTVAVTRCHDSIYHTLSIPQYEYEIGQPGFVYPVYDYDTLITIPSSVTHNGIEYSVTAIDKEAFYEQKSMRSVILPSTVQTIDTAAFHRSSVEYVEMPNVQQIRYGAFFIADLHSVQIPNGIANIEDYAFAYNRNLKQVDIPSSITVVRKGMFAWCSQLFDVDLPQNLDSIMENAFYSTPQLKKIAIPSEVSYIGSDAFGGGYDSAENNGLDTIIMDCVTPPEIDANAFSRLRDLHVFVPCHTTEAYQSAPGWSAYSNFTYHEDCVGVEDYEKGNVQMYPVPCRDRLCIQNKNVKICRVEVYDAFGTIVLSVEVKNAQTVLDMSGLPAGAYAIVAVEDNGQRQHARMVTKQ